MDDDVREELRLLRARAYGPHADIADDAAAVARLRELEDLERQDRVPPPPRSPVTSAAAAAGSRAAVVTPDGESDEEEDEDEDGDDGPRVRPALVGSKRRLWVWAASLAVVAALASAATAASLTLVPVSAAAGAPQVDTLVPAPDAAVPPVFGQRTGAERAYENYYGIAAFTGRSPTDATENRIPCLYLLDADEMGKDDTRAFRGNFVYGGCGAGVFPATVQFVVADGMPDAFIQRFPIGTSMQFVFDGENVGVFSDRG
ncbi:hypothetical protein [uncultured Microbacterium sp.]|uniref:hypothetical protein n=1 Tax=uncultured Microbacterium sp. TaxID=191216 RepID=UPI0025F64664|nr:hypothetical protein [uncultured Microbacterium sp.]